MNQMMESLAAEVGKASVNCERLEGAKRALEASVRDLEEDIKDWKQRYQKSENLISSLGVRSDEDMRTIQFLKEQLRQNEVARMILQDKIEGKRNLWLKVHEPQDRNALIDPVLRAGTPLSGQTFAMPMEQGYAQSITGSVRSGIHPGSSHSSTSISRSVHSGSNRPASVQPTGYPSAPMMFPGGHYLPPGQYMGGMPPMAPMQPAPGMPPMPPHMPPHMPGMPGMPGAAGYPHFAGIPQSQSGPAMYPSQSYQHRPSTASSGSVRSGVGYSSSRYSATSSRPSSTGPRRGPRVSIIEENGSPKERKRAVPHSLARTDIIDPAHRNWQEQFQTLFALVLGFCEAYLHELPDIEGEDAWKKHIETAADGDLWAYICKVGRYIQEQERGNHALRLLQDRDCRPFFMQRLILQHVISTVFTSDGWKGFSEDFDEEMEALDEEWKMVDPSRPVERQIIIDRRARLVAGMLDGERGEPFRSFKENQHHQFLKRLVTPFLAKRKNPNVATEAFYDLFAITQSAWSLSGKLYRSRLTFDYMWADAGSRFSADAHEPVDVQLDRFSLQRDHWRVKLCTTPSVTVRNDQGMTIETKHILKAGVLVMRF